MINILFVCLGNICRSPSGEGVFKALVKRENLETEFFVDSAGTSAFHVGELAVDITGEKLNPEYFKKYLENKYKQIYNL